MNSSTRAIEVANTFDSDQWKDRVVLITGTTNGIGYETVRGFAAMKHSPTLILANRSVERSKKAIEPITEEFKSVRIHHVTLDLSSLVSVRACIDEVKALNLPINVLLLNAGVLLEKYEESEEGYEKHFAINHLGHFVLTNGLIDTLVEAAEKSNNEFMSRVVVVSSHSHYQGEIDFNRLPLSLDSFGSIVTQKAYAQSKLCNTLFANELNRRMENEGKPIRANSLHPATMVHSNIGNGSSLVRMVMYIASFFTRSLEQAAATSVYCSINPELEGIGGKYFDACAEKEASKTANDASISAKLWEISVKLSEGK